MLWASGRAEQATLAQGCVKNCLGPGRPAVIRAARETNYDRHSHCSQLHHFTHTVYHDEVLKTFKTHAISVRLS